MKNFKIFSFFLIFILILSLSLQGCSPKDADIEENPEDRIEDNEEESNIEKDNEEKDEDAKNPDEEISQEESEDTDSNEEPLKEDTEAKEPHTTEKDDDSLGEVENPISEDSDQSKAENTINPNENSEENIEKENTTLEDNKDEKEKAEKNLLKIQGNVTNELSLSLDDLKSMNDIRFSGNYYSLNSFGTTDHTEFTGVNLWNLLNEKAGISPEATLISIIAIDGYQMDFEVEQIKKQDYIDETNPDVTFPIIIAWEENGEEYDPEEGPPYKLVVGQTEAGDVNKPQWVSVIDKIVVE